MLDNNTNKVVWIGVAVGVVAVIGAGALTLFPDAFSSSHDMIRQKQLVMADGSTNVLATTQTKLAPHVLQDDNTGTVAKYDDNTNFRLTLDSKTHKQGVFYGKGGSAASNNYDDFIKGDDWEMAADIKVVAGDVTKLDLMSLGVEASQGTVKWLSRPTKFTNDYQHFAVTGTRQGIWGAPVIYFINRSGSPVVVDIQNVTLHRK